MSSEHIVLLWEKEWKLHIGYRAKFATLISVLTRHIPIWKVRDLPVLDLNVHTKMLQNLSREGLSQLSLLRLAMQAIPLKVNVPESSSLLPKYFIHVNFGSNWDYCTVTTTRSCQVTCDAVHNEKSLVHRFSPKHDIRKKRPRWPRCDE